MVLPVAARHHVMMMVERKAPEAAAEVVKAAAKAAVEAAKAATEAAEAAAEAGAEAASAGAVAITQETLHNNVGFLNQIVLVIRIGMEAAKLRGERKRERERERKDT